MNTCSIMVFNFNFNFNFLNIYILICFLEAKRPNDPAVSLDESSNRIRFKCQIYRCCDNNRSSTYEVTWVESINGTSTDIYSEELIENNISYLENKADNKLYSLGVNVSS